MFDLEQGLYVVTDMYPFHLQARKASDLLPGITYN
jgi:hypothetical protein